MDAIKTFPKFSIFFLIVMCAEIAGLTVIPSFHQVSKAFIVASLIGFYITVEKRQSNIFLLGLIAALLGDCFLLFPSEEFFTIGLGCFLIMQLCYIAAFNRKRRVPKGKDILISGGIAVLGIVILASLWDTLGEMRLAVSLYVASIVGMAIYGYLRHPKLRGYTTVLGGIALFIISDTLLAVNMFSEEIPYGQIMVMVTYMLAQFFIVTGEVMSFRKKQQPQVVSTSAFGRHKAGN